jgi:8-oxo-dGTP pyrophosphatase MutT (NUDIX family)
MTCDEKLDIYSLDFSRIWDRIWIHNPNAQKDESKKYQDKFTNCAKYFTDNFCQDSGARLRYLLSKSCITESLWEIPGGRLNSLQEKKLNCAIREFAEEAQIRPSEYTIINETPFSCIINSGKIQYQNSYYLAIINPDSIYNKSNKLRLNYNNIDQIAEVTGIQWANIDQIRALDLTNRLYPLAKRIFKVFKKYNTIP